MNKKQNSLDFMTQAELAGALGVDRTTVGTWTKKGLPFIKGDQGKPHTFHFPCSMWWMLGKDFTETRGISGLTAVQQIIFARAIADEIDPGDDMAGEEWMIPMLAEIGIPESTVISEIAYVRGVMAGVKISGQKRKKRKLGRQLSRDELKA